MDKVTNYIKESYDELMHKVTWPTWSELQNSTVLVTVASIIIALMVFVMDFIVGITGDKGDMWRGVLGFFYDLFKQ